MAKKQKKQQKQKTSGSKKPPERASAAKAEASAKASAKADAKPRAKSKAAAAPERDPLDDFISATAQTLALPIEPAWQPAVKTNLAIILRQAALFTEFPLPDDAEPAPVFEA